MTLRLSTRDAGFDAAFTALVNARREADEEVSRDVTVILKRIRDVGDAPLADYTRRFDRHGLNATGWTVAAAERKEDRKTVNEGKRVSGLGTHGVRRNAQTKNRNMTNKQE